MINEIYCRMPSDAKYVPKIETSSEIEQILQRIRVILGTNRGDVLGDFSFGTDIKKYIFSMDFNVDEMTILSIITSDRMQIYAIKTKLHHIGCKNSE